MLTTKNWDALVITLAFGTLAVVLLGGCAPSGPHALVEGERLVREGRYVQATEKLELATQLLEGAPQALAWNHLGVAYHKAGQLPSAIAAYRQALQRNPNLAAARFNLGCLHLEQNELATAISEFTTYTVLERNAVNGWIKLGAAQLRARQFDAAERSFASALQLNGSLPEAFNGLAIIQVQRKRPLEAQKYLNAALQRQLNYPPALLNSAVLYHQYLTNLSFAAQRYRNYLAVAPQAANADAVRETIRQVELALIPPARPAITNPVLTRTEPGHQLGTSTPVALSTTNKMTVVAASAPAPPREPDRATPRDLPSAVTNLSNPKPVTAVAPQILQATNPATFTPSAEPAEPPPPKIDIVRLTEDEPPPKVAEDVPVIPEPRVAATNVLTVVPQPAPPPDATPTNSVPPDLASGVPSDDPVNKSRWEGAVDRLNPLSWFRTKKKGTQPRTEEKRTSVTPIPAVTMTNFAERAATNSAVAPTPEPVVVRSIPRYVYRTRTRPVAGERRKAEPFFAEGLKAHQERRLTAAIEAYREAVKLDPAYYEAHYNLGLAAYYLRDVAQALSSYEEALSIKPTSGGARYNFALALQRGGYFHDSAAELEKILADRPDDARAHFTLAKLYADELARRDQAQAHYLKVLELEPQHTQATAIRYWVNEQTQSSTNR